jgi:hypothetical protein
MKRHVFDTLVVWKEAPTRKPLVLRGARQVGKTWLMREFGRQSFANSAYVNFESDPALKEIFATDFDTERLITALQIASGQTIAAGKTLIILDEIQEAPGAITSLKYFQENAPQYHVIAAGSLLGVALGNQVSFPVGKVTFLDLHPLNFHEFLGAIGEVDLAELLTRRDWPMITAFKARLIEKLRMYYYVGGMPEAVQAFVDRANFEEVRTIQLNILQGYEQDFAKHAPGQIIPRIRMLWKAIPAQLAKENRKFIYGQVKAGARAKDFELALAWLVDCGLAHRIHNVTKPAVPLKMYENFNAFKLFALDVGLFGAMVRMDARTLLEGGRIFEEFKGALTEQFVLQQLLSIGAEVYYWSAENSRAEVDFLVQAHDKIVPMEVKAAENLQSKSLKVYCEKYRPKVAIRTSMSDYREESWMTNVPLYGVASYIQALHDRE